MSRRKQSPFVRQASPFQDLVIRCVRYAFANLPAEVGKVFFSKAVALPFFRFRLLRHGYLQPPVKWEEVSEVGRRSLLVSFLLNPEQNGFRGLLVRHEEEEEPDVVVYYCHGKLKS